MQVNLKQPKVCLAIDLGGTKLEMGVVQEDGEILSLRRELLKLDLGKDYLIHSMITWAQEFITEYPQIIEIGISSCGPLDPIEGVLHDPTNLLTNGKGWGLVPLRAIIEGALAKKTYLDNDAACCVLAERYLGVGRIGPCTNLMVLTLGTGLGTGVICNGRLFRSGRNQHPEAGHMIIDFQNKDDPCACGVYGDAEAFLSGNHFSFRFNRQHHTSYSAQQIAELARKNNPEALSAFDYYAEVMAVALHNYCVMFCPEKIVFSGSFAATYDLFESKLKKQLEHLLARRRNIVPQVFCSELKNHACLLGAAFLCFKNEKFAHY